MTKPLLDTIAQRLAKDILKAYQDYQDECADYPFMEALGFGYQPTQAIACIRDANLDLSLVDVLVLEDLLFGTDILLAISHEVEHNGEYGRNRVQQRLVDKLAQLVDEYYPFKEVAERLETAFHHRLLTEYLPLLKETLTDIRYRRIMSRLAGDQSRELLDDEALNDLYRLRDQLIDRLGGPITPEVEHVITYPDRLPDAAFRLQVEARLRHDTPIEWLTRPDIGCLLFIQYYWNCIKYAFNYHKFVVENINRYIDQYGQEQAILLLNAQKPSPFLLPLESHRSLIPTQYASVEYVSKLVDEIVDAQ